MKQGKIFQTNRLFHLLLGTVLLLGTTPYAFSDAIFLTGHDPDYHVIGPNQTGAIDLLHAGLNYVLDPSLNSFAAAGIGKFLFVEGDPTLGDIPQQMANVDNVDGAVSLTNIGITNFDVATASGLTTALGKLGQQNGYSALVVASDFGGILTQAELNILDAHSQDIMNFLNAGGGLFAMAESNSYVLGNDSGGLAPDGGQFGFLPFVQTTYVSNPGTLESGFTLTPFGQSLGLSSSDVNGNYAHNAFASTYGLHVVDYDSGGRIISLAGTGEVTPNGVVPEPATLLLLATGLSGIAATFRKRRV